MSKYPELINATVKRQCSLLSKRITAVAINTQRGCLLIFLLAASVLGVWLILDGIRGTHTSHHVSINSIETPKDIYMREAENKEGLIMVGKMKGEINGEFEAFYLAVNRHGEMFVNHDLSLNQEPSKSPGWQSISRQQLEEYEKHLHFLPLKNNRLSH